MSLTKDDDVIKTFPSDRADQPLRISVLPGRPRRGRSIPHAHRCNAPHEGSAICAVAVNAAADAGEAVKTAEAFREAAASARALAETLEQAEEPALRRDRQPDRRADGRVTAELTIWRGRFNRSSRPV